eukprot:TRINITY_DN41117_c0_g2_i1.p1 TRINITY_DN41117_c0_g2~~TRINITY_DN41117_c0_g2_i1.p1  ORF type:complete len:480 (+),score=38.10 TRINITY_DN41117_c0_g2_i1:92-1441(+)
MMDILLRSSVRRRLVRRSLRNNCGTASWTSYQRSVLNGATVVGHHQRKAVRCLCDKPRTENNLGGIGDDDETRRLKDLWGLHRRGRGVSRASPDEIWVSRLTLELEAFVEQFRPSPDREAARQRVIQRVERAAMGAVDGCSTVLFGSAVTGLWTPESDLDVCLLVPGVGHEHRAQARSLQKIAAELRKVGGASYHVLPRLTAHMPIVRWAARKPGLISCDISVNNSLAVANSRLLAQYMQVDDRLCRIGICVKAWARRRGINSRSHGSLSSFALTLMLIHVFQRLTPPALPSLQDLAARLRQPSLFLQGQDCKYSTDSAEIASELARLRGGRPPATEALGWLLHEFFRYFAYEYEHGVIAIRECKQFERDDSERQCYLAVDNPFELGKDVANVDPRLQTRIREEFRRAHALLDDGCSFAEVCASPPLPGLCPLTGPLLPGVNCVVGNRS